MHTLRHTAISQWLRAHPAHVASKSAGHSSTYYTQDEYGHLYPNQRADLASALDARYHAEGIGIDNEPDPQ